MKKLISMLVVLAMLMAMVPAAFAAEAVKTDTYREVTISKAVELAERASDAKYLVRGTVTKVTDATNGNMYIEDAEGNTLYIYGVYDADGAARYDAMSTKPQVGDEVLLLGTLMTYGGTARMKNAQVKELVVGTLAETNTDTNLILGNNELTAGRNESSEYVYVAEQTGTLYLTLRSYTCNGIEYGETMLGYGWSELIINGEPLDSSKKTLEVTAGDTITIQMTSDYDLYVAWLYLSYEDFYVEPVGTKINPVLLDPTECPTTTIEIPAGGEVWYELTSDFSEHILYVYGENAYIEYTGWLGNVQGPIRVEPTDGVVTYEIWEYKFCIGNTGTEAAVFTLDCEIPLGSQKNPHPIVNGEQIVNIVAGRGAQYMAGYAPVTGTLTVTVETEVEGYWSFTLQNPGDPNSYMDDVYEYISNSGNSGNTVTIDVKQGDYITANVRLNDLDWNDCNGAVKVTFEFDGVAEEPEEPTDLELGHVSADIAEGKETVYTWTADADCLFAINMLSGNWTYRVDVTDAQGTVRSSSDAAVVNMTVVKVNAGDMVTLTIGTADGAAAAVDFTAATYEGTASNPVALELIWNYSYTAASLNADLPAGEYVYSLPIFGAGSLELTINGVVTAFNADPMGWDPATVVINNEGEGNAVYSFSIAPPVGTMYNPDKLVMGYNEAQMIFADYQMMRAYAFTAEEDTLLSLTMMGDNWYYWGMIQDANGMTTAWVDGHDATADPFVPVQVVKVAAGETFVLILGTVDGSETVAFNAMANAGTEADPVMLEMIWNASYTAASLNVDLPAGEYVYALPIFGAGSLELTINGEVTEFNADPMGWDPATVVINNDTEAYAVYSLSIAPPIGTMYNPDELVMGYNEAQMIFADYQMMRAYAFTAEEDTLLALTMMGENWYYWGMMQDANGMTTAWVDGHDAMTDPFVPMQVVKVAAGETFVLILGTVDGSETVEFSAMTYAGTAEDPVMLEFVWNDEGTAASLNADLPAGEYVYGGYFAGMTLTVNGEETAYTAGSWRTPCTFTINNEGETYAVYALELNYPVGSWMNPELVEEGEYTAEIEAGNYEGYFYNWIAPANGTLTVTVSADTGWYYTVNNVTAGLYGDANWSDDDPVVDTLTIQVSEGDVIEIVVNVYDPENGMGVAGEVNVSLTFAPVVAQLGDVNGDGAIDTTDAKLVMQYDLGLVDETALDLTMADVNGDGAIDTTDAKLIMQLDLGIIEEF